MIVMSVINDNLYTIFDIVENKVPVLLKEEIEKQMKEDNNIKSQYKNIQKYSYINTIKKVNKKKINGDDVNVENKCSNLSRFFKKN